MAPKLLGIVKLEMPWVRKRSAAEIQAHRYQEKIQHIGFDTDGQAWGLVCRFTPIELPPPAPGEDPRYHPIGAGRLDYVRWVAMDALPFVPEERVTPEGWGTGQVLGG